MSKTASDRPRMVSISNRDVPSSSVPLNRGHGGIAECRKRAVFMAAVANCSAVAGRNNVVNCAYRFKV